MNGEDRFRTRLDALICQTWCEMRNLDDYSKGEAITQDDLELWSRLTTHPAIQRVLEVARLEDGQ